MIPCGYCGQEGEFPSEVAIDSTSQPACVNVGDCGARYWAQIKQREEDRLDRIEEVF